MRSRCRPRPVSMSWSPATPRGSREPSAEPSRLPLMEGSRMQVDRPGCSRSARPRWRRVRRRLPRAARARARAAPGARAGPVRWVAQLHPARHPCRSTCGSVFVPGLERARDQPRVGIVGCELRELVRLVPQPLQQSSLRVALALREQYLAAGLDRCSDLVPNRARSRIVVAGAAAAAGIHRLAEPEVQAFGPREQCQSIPRGIGGIGRPTSRRISAETCAAIGVSPP